MRQTILAASLIAVVLIVVFSLFHITDVYTGYMFNLVSGTDTGLTMAIGLIAIGILFAFLWNK